MSTDSYLNRLLLQDLDQHFHGPERWRGPQAGPGRVAGDVLAAFQAVSGNNAYGVALQIADVNDTPIIPGMVGFDVRLFFVTLVSNNNFGKIRLIWGVSNAAAAEAANQYGEVVYQEDAGVTPRRPVEIHCPRLPVGTLVWVRYWQVTNLAQFNFQYAVHQYPPPLVDVPVLV